MRQPYTYSLAALATAVVIFNFTACKQKDNDEDIIPFKSTRLEGNWNVISIDGDPIGPDFEMEMEFEIDGDFKYTYSYDYYGYDYSYTQRGKWEWKNDKKTIRINLGGQIDFDLIRLKERELSWSYYGDVWELEK